MLVHMVTECRNIPLSKQCHGKERRLKFACRSMISGLVRRAHSTWSRL
jgi:hypothetical protein